MFEKVFENKIAEIFSAILFLRNFQRFGNFIYLKQFT